MEIDGAYDIVHVEIIAKMSDGFYCELDKKLNRNSNETFSEYWSFIRKCSSKQNSSINKKCPNCGAIIENVNNIEIAQCTYCQSILNTSDYDWILSEITQDYKDIKLGINNRYSIYNKNMNFSKQLLEDKVSNGVVQIDKSIALNIPYLAKRFVSDKVYKSILKGTKNYFFNTYYIEYCTLVSIDSKKDKDYYYAKVKISRNYERAEIEKGNLVYLDNKVKNKISTVYLKKSKKDYNIKGDIYANQCPNCGGNLLDTIDTHCSYCNVIIAEPKYDWIIYDMNGFI